MDSLVVENLSKCYHLGVPSGKGARRGVREWLRSPLGGAGAARREFWALKDVSFRVERGTILGVIGANGAGKSTLLKVLARVTTPTGGRVVGAGRVVSLLELGAGFDPDLPADKNILMNAAMLGVSAAEARRRTPEILEFAEIDQFANTPLRHYSSGMYLRLAFSVAINMNPQILLADEILAVGDQAFRERCLQKVQESGREGLTVLFVSHDMDAILRICNRVLWLNGGEIVRIGEPDEVVDEYEQATWSHADDTHSERGRRSNRLAELLSVRLVSAEGKDIGGAPVSEDVFVKVRFQTTKRNLRVRPAVDLKANGILVFRATGDEEWSVQERGVYEAFAKIPANLLAEISYTVSVSVTFRKGDDGKGRPLIVYNALSFLAFSADERQVTGIAKANRVGCLAPQLEWRLHQEEEHAAPRVKADAAHS